MTNAELDKKVAELQGWKLLTKNFMGLGESNHWYDNEPQEGFPEGMNIFSESEYCPTTNSSQAMELLKKYKLTAEWIADCGWQVCARSSTIFIEDELEKAIVLATIALLESEE